MLYIRGAFLFCFAMVFRKFMIWTVIALTAVSADVKKFLSRIYEDGIWRDHRPILIEF